MHSSVDRRLRAAARSLRAHQRYGRTRLFRPELDRVLDELAATDLEPKEAAARVQQLLYPRQRASPPLLMFGILVTLIGVIFSIGLFLSLRDNLAAVPANLNLTISPPNVPADGIARAEIQVMVTNQLGQPLRDDIEVEFQLQPSAMGNIEPVRVPIINGRAETVFKAGTLPGEAQVIARVSEQAQQLQTIQLTGVSILSTNLTVRPAQTVMSSELITFTLSASNSGNGPATNVRMFSALPSGTSFVAASDQEHLSLDSRGIEWEIGSLAPGTTITRTLIVRVDQIEMGSITSSTYGIRDSGGNEIRGDQQISLEVVASTPRKPAQITLAVPPPTLPASGQSVALNATVLDQSGQQLDGIPITFTLHPQEINGSSTIITPTKVTTPTVGGIATISVTVGTIPGEVEIIASTGAISASAKIGFTPCEQTVTTETINIRAEPGTNADPLDTLPKESLVDLLCEEPHKVGSEDWVRVRAVKPDKIIIGWVNRAYLTRK